MARRWFPAIRNRLSGADPNTLDSRITSTPRGYVVPGQPYFNEWNVDRAVTEGYAWNPYVYRAVEFIAQNERARRVVLRDGDPDTGATIDPSRQDREQRRILRTLNRRANPWEVAQIWRHRLTAQFLLSSRGVFIEAVRTRSGGIHSLYLLDPDRVDIVPGRRPTDGQQPDTMPYGMQQMGAITPIEAFRVTHGTPGAPHWEHRPPFDPHADPQEQPSGIVWIRSPHPTILARGMSPMEAAGLSTDLDRMARLYNRRFMAEDGRPGGILAVKGPLSDEYAEILQRRFQGGPDVSGARTTVIEADEMNWTDTSGHPRDTQWGDTMDRTRQEIATAFGLSESALTGASGETFDNADADYARDWEHCMLPLFRLLDAQLDVLTPGGFDDDTFLAHDVSDVWVLGRHQRAREDRAAEDLARGAITIDEYREVCDLEPLNVPATRVLWIEPQKLAIEDGTPAHDGDAEEAASAPMGNGQPTPPAEGVPGQLPPDMGGQPPAGEGPPEREPLRAESRRTDRPDEDDEYGWDPPALRAAARADRSPPGDEVDAVEPERKDLEGEQRGARPAGR